MKTLERFWQWFDAEKPDSVVAADKAYSNISELAWESLNDAAGKITARGGESAMALLWAFDGHAGALRDLSLALCAALERMRAAVPEKPPEPRSVWATQAEVNMVLANSTYAVPPAPPAQWWRQDEVFMANYGVQDC